MTTGSSSPRQLSLSVSTLCAFPAAADRLTEAYAARPRRSRPTAQLSLQYALIAEGRHEYRKALSAYERVLLNDPEQRRPPSAA